MRRTPAVVALLLVLPMAGAAPVPKHLMPEGGPTSLYMPVTVGAKRVLAVSYNGNTLDVTEAVTAVEAKGGVYVVTVEDQPAGGQTGKSVYEVSAKGVAVRQNGRADPVLKAGAKAGGTWETTATMAGWAVKTTYTLGAEEQVQVAAGTFRAVRVDMVAESGGAIRLRTTAWYAPGVGLVKAATSGNVTSAVELKSFTPGK